MQIMQDIQNMQSMQNMQNMHNMHNMQNMQNMQKQTCTQVTTVCVGLVCERGYKYGWLDYWLLRVDRTLKTEGQCK